MRRQRFIPTGVGNTLAACLACSLRSVHPHRRGEHSSRRHVSISLAGSSPQAWGTPQEHRQNSKRSRFIPTGVGNTRDRPLRWKHLSVHPHRRGEHPSMQVVSAVLPGSSPQAWGTLFTGITSHAVRRFIPTGVGNTDVVPYGPSANTVHPHRRGEHKLFSWLIFPPCGSSPQAWGTRVKFSGEREVGRFIPTGVGNTRTKSFTAPRTSVHPHRRGEHHYVAGRRVRDIGSSPQAWGTPK